MIETMKIQNISVEVFQPIFNMLTPISLYLEGFDADSSAPRRSRRRSREKIFKECINHENSKERYNPIST